MTVMLQDKPDTEKTVPMGKSLLALLSFAAGMVGRYILATRAVVDSIYEQATRCRPPLGAGSGRVLIGR